MICVTNSLQKVAAVLHHFIVHFYLYILFFVYFLFFCKNKLSLHSTPHIK